MTINVASWIKETCVTSGTGALVLTSTDSTYIRFNAALVANDEVYYAILDSNGNRETGIGTFDGTATIVRTTISATLNGTTYNDTNPTPLSLTGNSQVICTFTAEAYADLLTLINNGVAEIAGTTKTFWFYSSDVTTLTAPISHTGGAQDTYLTNDAAGTITESYNPDGNDSIWDVSTQTFDFSSLKIGDVVEFRIDLVIDHGAAQELDVLIDVAEGHADAYTLNVNHSYYKTASTDIPWNSLFRLYIGNDFTKNNPARLRLASADAATIHIAGWFVQVTEV
jgi:hypothetical protein